MHHFLHLFYTVELIIRPINGPSGRRLQLEIGGKALVGVRASGWLATSLAIGEGVRTW